MHLVGYFELFPTGTTFQAKNRGSLFASRDTWTAPVQVKVGPDGAVWVSDFYSLVSQHNPTPKYPDSSCCPHGVGNAYETPNRDADHARIYRITYDGAPEYTPLRLDTATPQQLVETLGERAPRLKGGQRPVPLLHQGTRAEKGRDAGKGEQTGESVAPGHRGGMIYSHPRGPIN